MLEGPATPAEYRTIWNAKPVLREVYGDYYRRIEHARVPGPTVEIGAGSGNLADVLPGVHSTDIVSMPWLDAVADAQALPFRDAAVSNLVGVDVMHHVEFSRRLLDEAQRVLQPGGRLILIEPAVTPLSWVMFKVAHPEPVDLRADPFADGPRRVDRHPLDANQAVPTLLTGRYRARLQREFPALRLITRERLSLVAYPLSGGFRPWSLMPSRLVSSALRLEQKVMPVLGPVMGFRLFLVFERGRVPAPKPAARRAVR